MLPLIVAYSMILFQQQECKWDLSFDFAFCTQEKEGSIRLSGAAAAVCKNEEAAMKLNTWPICMTSQRPPSYTTVQWYKYVACHWNWIKKDRGELWGCLFFVAWWLLASFVTNGRFAKDHLERKYCKTGRASCSLVELISLYDCWILM